MVKILVMAASRFLFWTSITLTILNNSFGQCPIQDSRFISHCVDLKKQSIRFYWKDEQQTLYGNFGRLKEALEEKGQRLLFATNGGMYQSNNTAVGLYIENGKMIKHLNRANATGNFYLKPNGIFLINKNNTASIIPTEKYQSKSEIRYATQSGPMLIINGSIHPAFAKNSSNKNIRNGVGILPGGQLLFLMSKGPISFYEFAEYFLYTGCRNALYLDGFVSRTYLPSANWTQTDGNFGVIIAEISDKK